MAFKQVWAGALLLALAAPVSAADYVYATKDVTARRWQDAETPTSGDVKINDRLEVVFKTDAWLRVRIPKSPKFGWIPADAVTTEVPAGADAPAAPAGGASLEGLSPEMQKMVQERLKQLQKPGGDTGSSDGTEDEP